MLNILPRDERYFERFNEMSVRTHEAAKILDGFFQGKAALATVADQVKRLEHECDEISHEILRTSTAPSSPRSTARTSTASPCASTTSWT